MIERIRVNGMVGRIDGTMDDSTTDIYIMEPLRDMGGNLVPTISSPDFMTILVDNEMMKLVDYVTDSLSGEVVRGQFGTAATSHGPGARVANPIAAEDMEDAVMSSDQSVRNILVMDQTTYDGLGSYDSDTLYLITA